MKYHFQVNLTHDPKGEEKNRLICTSEMDLVVHS